MILKRLLICIIISLTMTQAWAQSSSGSFLGVRKNVAMVMFAGLGGAVLGLSTLSFYGTPEEHVSNIWTGLALGVIGGVVYISVDSQRYSSWTPPVRFPSNPHQALPPKLNALSYHWSF